MAQHKTWEREYRNKKFVTGHDEPQKFILRFLKFLRKKENVDIEKFKVLDLGCGTGRNSNYLAKLGAEVSGMEISETALNIARKRALESNLDVLYLKQSIGDKYQFPDNYFDLILDVTSSNSLNEKEREMYLQEASRVLKNNGYFFVRTLCKDGDKNAKKLLKISPGPETDTYIMPEVGLVEKVFSKIDLEKIYAKYFNILQISKETGYTRFSERKYKRNFWIIYCKKGGMD